MLTLKTNSPTFWLEAVFRVTNGIIFSVCSTSSVSRCSRVVISVIFFLTIGSESRAPSDGRAETNNPGKGGTTQLGSTQLVEWEKLFAVFGYLVIPENVDERKERLRCKQPFILCRILWRSWRSTRTRTSRRKFSPNHSEVDIKTFRRNSECETAWKFISLMDEISTVSWSSEQAGTSKGRCLLRFCSLRGTDEWKQRSNNKMGKLSGRTQDASFLQRTCRDRWGSNWIRVEYFPRIFVIEDSSRDPTRQRKKEHQTWRVHGPDRLHVNVQRHRLDNKRKWWELYFECRKSQELREDIFARTLDVSGCWDRKRSGMEDLLTLLLESGTPQPMKWYNDSKKQVITCSKSISAVSHGILKRKKGKKTIHFNGDSSNREFLFQTCQISSICTEQWRIGANNSAWQRKRKNEIIYLWKNMTSVPPHEVQFLEFLPTMASGNSLQKTFWASKHRPTEWSSQSYVRTLGLSIAFQPWWCIKLDLTRTTVVGKFLHYVGNTFSRAHLQSRVFVAVPGGTTKTPVLEVQIVKILGQSGLERFQFHQLSNIKRHLTLWLPEERRQRWTQTQHRIALSTSEIRRERILRKRIQ